jgi:hypothetical protein
VLIAFAFDWGLILLTAWAGARQSLMACKLAEPGEFDRNGELLVLLVVRVVVQVSQLRKQ